MFGGRRFAAFPVFIVLSIASVAIAAHSIGIRFAQIATSLHVLVAFFGFHTGSIAFISDDAIDNVLGDTTFIIFSSHTLPVSQRTLYVAFILKDIVYYTALFIVPIAFGLIPFVFIGSTAPASILVLTVSLLSVFILGLVTVVTLVAVWNHGTPGSIISITALVGCVALFASGYDVLAWTPFNAVTFTTSNVTFVADPVRVGRGYASVAVGIVASIVLNPVSTVTTDTTTRARENTYAWLRDRLPFTDNTGLTAKTLVDLHRSSGSIMKPVFSMFIMFLVAASLDVFFVRMLGLWPDPVLWYPVLVSLSAFTTYNWLTQSDSVDEYMHLPVSPRMLLDAKTQAFALVSLTTVPFYIAGIIVGSYLRTGYTVTPVGFGAGLVVLAAFTMYFFKITVLLTGFDPSALLFDTAKFAAFTAATFVLIPVLLVAFGRPSAGSLAAYGMVTSGATVLATGVMLVPNAQYENYKQ